MRRRRALHVKPIRTDTRLARAAKLVRHQLIDRPVEIGVIKHNEWSVAAQFQGQTFQVRRGLGRKELLANRCRSRKANHADRRMFAQYVTDLACRTEHEVGFAWR